MNLTIILVCFGVLAAWLSLAFVPEIVSFFKRRRMLSCYKDINLLTAKTANKNAISFVRQQIKIKEKEEEDDEDKVNHDLNKKLLEIIMNVIHQKSQEGIYSACFSFSDDQPIIGYVDSYRISSTNKFSIKNYFYVSKILRNLGYRIIIKNDALLINW